MGYARSQFRRMTHTPEPQPERERLIRGLKAEIEYRKNVKEGDPPFGNRDFERLSIQEMQRRVNALKGQKGWMGAKRKALVEKHGHDVKNSAHLIRLLRMGIEFLETGELRVRRPDADELVAIKRGEWPLEKTVREAEKLFAKAEEAYERSALPERPDAEKAEEICVSVVRNVCITA